MTRIELYYLKFLHLLFGFNNFLFFFEKCIFLESQLGLLLIWTSLFFIHGLY
jgi:hypothetical protein